MDIQKLEDGTFQTTIQPVTPPPIVTKFSISEKEFSLKNDRDYLNSLTATFEKEIAPLRQRIEETENILKKCKDFEVEKVKDETLVNEAPITEVLQ